MLRWYLKWKDRRTHKGIAYKINCQIDKPLFGPGFLGNLQSPSFWNSHLSKYESSYKLRQYIVFCIVIIVIAAVIWFFIKSTEAINLF